MVKFKGFRPAWGSISLFGGFLENENSLETLIVIFENVSPKGFFWLNMKNFEISGKFLNRFQGVVLLAETISSFQVTFKAS